MLATKPAASTQAPRGPVPRRIEDLPGPRGWPLLGQLTQIDPARLHQNLEAWGRTFGPLYRIRLGRRRIVVVGDHQLVAAVLRDRPDGFRRTLLLERVWTELGLPPGVFGANGEAWRRQRRMVMAGFDPAHVKRYLPQLQTVAARLGERWARAAREGASIDLQADLMRYTVDTIAGLAFGAEVNTLQSDGDVIQQHLDQLFPALHRRMLAPLPTWRWLRSAADRRLERSLVEVLAAVDGFIAMARARLQAAGPDPQPDNLLEAMLLAAAAPGSDAGRIDDAEVAGNVLTMLLAGEDTTANSIAWSIDLLWRHPDALARAVAEVRGVIAADALPDGASLAQLPYLEACLHETMRLKPVAPIIGLQALRDTLLGDLAVPARTVLLALMRHDSVSDVHVPNAAAFEPARWLEPAGGAAGDAPGLRRLSMPFGAGPRICPGRYLALLEMKMALAMLLSRFDIVSVDTPDGRPAPERLSFTMMPVGQRLRLRLRP